MYVKKEQLFKIDKENINIPRVEIYDHHGYFLIIVLITPIIYLPDKLLNNPPAQKYASPRLTFRIKVNMDNIRCYQRLN